MGCLFAPFFCASKFFIPIGIFFYLCSMAYSAPLTKAEKTSLYILEKVAPVFNKKGYAGTSMADITAVTGLTKGAIYGNFESKEKLALAAFNYNFKLIIDRLNKVVAAQDSALDKLNAIVGFYRNYYSVVIDYGGCPIVNLSVDAHYQNPPLFARATQIMERMIDKMAVIIEQGKQQGVIREEVKAHDCAKLIFSQIEGGIFTAVMSGDPRCLEIVVDHVEKMIKNELKK